jgi:hypothetical protein
MIGERLKAARLAPSNRFARCYLQTKSQPIVGLQQHSFLLLESATHVGYREAPIQRRWLP